MIRNIVQIVLVFNAFLLYASSQTILTLDRCLALAHEYSPRLRSAGNTLRAAEFSNKELSISKLPQVKLNGSTIYAPSSGKFGYDPALSDGGQISGQLMLQQSLYDGGIRSLKSDQITLDISRLEKERRIVERDLIFSVKQAFYETLRSKQEITLQEESVGELSDYLDIVRRLSKGGNAAYTDVLKTELQLSNAQLSCQKASEEYAVAKYSLAELIGISIDSAFGISGSLDDTIYVGTDSLLWNQRSDPAKNLELSIADLEIKHSTLEIELTQHERYPTVSFIGDAGLLTSGDNLRLPQDERSGMWGFSIGLLLDIPLFSWGAADLRVQQKQLDVDNLKLQSESLRRSILSEAKKAQLQLAKQRERLHFLRMNRKSAEDNFLLTKSKFTGGGALSLEVLSAQQLLTEIKLSELQTLADIRLLAAKIERLIAY